jgi:dCTP deaminase
MILSGAEIKKQVDQKKIHISPFSESYLNPNSYNYRLSPRLLEITDDPIDPRSKNKYLQIEIPENGYILEPGRLYLGSTFEEIGSSDFVITLIGRSSLGRLGLFLQITADLSQLGSDHCWTLELKVVQPLIVYPLMKIGQVSFWTVDGQPESYYQGKYCHDFSPHHSEIYHELNR